MKCIPSALRTLATVSAGLLSLAGSAAAQEPRPNIIFFIGDDNDRFMFNTLLNLNDQDAIERRLSPNPVLSPNLDRLCREGVFFPNHHVVSAACTPTRYAVLTGRYGSRATNFGPGTTYPFFNMEIQPANQSLAKLLQQAGYRTGFTGKDHVHECNSFVPGATALSQLQQNAANVEAAIKLCGFDYAENVYHKNPAEYPANCHNMDWIAKGGIDFLDDWGANHTNQPFFLYFATTLTHAPDQNSKNWQADRYATPEGTVTFDSPLIEAGTTNWTRDTITNRLVSAGIDPANRLGIVLWMDDALGALMKKLEDLGVDDNTLIFYFNDHGVEYGGKSGLYEHGEKSLSIVWKKSGFPLGTNAVCNALLSNVDFAPTILDYAGVEPPLGLFDGKSYRSILENKTSEIRKSMLIEFGCARGVIMDGFKYFTVRWPSSISNPEANSIGWASLKPYTFTDMEGKVNDNFPNYYATNQLYDLSTRISKTHPNFGGTILEDEQINLATNAAYAARLQLMKDELKKYLDTMPGPYAEFKNVQQELHPGATFQIR